MALDKRDSIETAFQDLSKAYDRVTIPGLIYKLSLYGFSRAAIEWFSAFLTNRQQRTRVNDHYSLWETTKSGIPQDTVLGPVLFLIFVNALPQSLSGDCAIFADDTTSFSIGKKSKDICAKLTLDLDAASDWATTWGMVFNAEKSAHLSVHCNNPSSTSDKITMKGVLIPQVKTCKHLGLTINYALKWTDHINNTYTTCARQVGILRRLRKKLDPSVIKRIYTGAIRPKMEYACAIWNGGTTTKLVELQKTFCRRHNIDLPPLQQRFLYFIYLKFA